jgi:nucleotide-binding universal stress UspA family protein
MFGNILVPLDGSPMAARILPHVAAIAQVDGSPAAITLLRVLETDDVASTAVDPLAWRFAQNEAQAYLDEMAGQLAQLGLSSNTVLLEGGDGARRIIEYIDAHNVDLLLLSTHGHGGLSDWNVSSVAQKLVHRAGTSIMLVRSSDESAAEHTEAHTQTIQYRHVLMPLDGSQRSESILPLACALAERHAAELLVVHIVQRPEMIQRVPLSQEDIAMSTGLITRNTLAATRYFAQLQTRLPANTQTRVITEDSVTQALHHIVEQEQIDLVVLRAHGHTCNSWLPYSALVNSFITYGVTSLLILQDLSSNQIRRARGEPTTELLTLPTRSAHEDEGRNGRAHFTIE